MFVSRSGSLVRCISGCYTITRRRILSKNFALNEEWRKRHSAFRELGIEGGYEWIAAVQKKIASAQMASAVDVDAAVCTAEESDQLDDVLKIIYKLRHTEMTGDMLSSTEYALIRLFLKHNDTATLLAVLSDPINYGIFLNEHSACLLIDNLLEAGNVAGAAQTASHVMLQELFQSALLNWLCMYSALKWTELPTEKRVFEELPKLNFFTGLEEDSRNSGDDENEKTFKFPYLKNEYNDMHFDLSDPDQLVGKSLLWFVNHLPLNEEEGNSIRYIGSVFFGDHDLAKHLLKTTKLCPSAIEVCRFKLEETTKTAIDSDENQSDQIVTDKKKGVNVEEKLSERILRHLKTVQETEENNLMKKQLASFVSWEQNRADLVKAQVEQLDLTLRLKEINEERQKLRDHWELLNFFENRLQWEDMAEVKEAILSAEQGKVKSKEDMEQEYVDRVFRNKYAQHS